MAIRFINLGDIQGFLDVFWQSKQENQSCTDSDNGKNKYMKGEIVVWNPDGSKKLSKVEKCQNGDYLLKTGSHINANPNAVYVEEYFCEETLYDSTYLYSSTYYECPNGCNDGACIK